MLPLPNYYIFECQSCRNIKLVDSFQPTADIKCNCAEEKIELFGLFNDGEIFKLSLKRGFIKKFREDMEKRNGK